MLLMYKCTGIQHESKTVFTCGKTSTQQLRQCGNDVNSYSGWLTILIQFIFCTYRVMCGRMKLKCVCACYHTIRACRSVRVCLWVSNVVTKPVLCGLRGRKKVSALHQFHLAFTVKHCSKHCSVTWNLCFHAKAKHNIHLHLPWVLHITLHPPLNHFTWSWPDL